MVWDLESFINRTERRATKVLRATAFDVFRAAVRITPKDEGVTGKKWDFQVNGASFSSPNLGAIEIGDVVSVVHFDPHMAKLDQGTYSNPGKERTHKRPVGRVLGRTKSGRYRVIRTTHTGFSIQAPAGLLNPLRTIMKSAWAKWAKYYFRENR